MLSFPDAVRKIRARIIKQNGPGGYALCRCGNPLNVGKSFLQDSGENESNNVTYKCENCGIISCWNFDLGGPALIKKWECFPPEANVLEELRDLEDKYLDAWIKLWQKLPFDRNKT